MNHPRLLRKSSLKFYVLICILGVNIVTFLTGCQDKKTSPASSQIASQPTPASPEFTSLIESSNFFGLDLLKELVVISSASENPAVSPISLSQVFYLMANGASPDVEAKLKREMKIRLDWAGLNQANNAWLNQLSNISGYELTVATSIWTAPDVRLQPDFQKITQQYKVELESFLKEPDQTVEAINNWITRRTNGKIRSGIDELDRTDLLLINAVYFRGVWSQPFSPDATEVADFTATDGSVETVQMMSQSGDFIYSEIEGGQLVKLPYVGNASMVLMLPPEGESLRGFFYSITSKVLGGLTHEAMREGKVDIPRFRLDFTTDLRQALKHMGLDSMLNSSEYSSISKQISEDGDIRLTHNVVIEVDEKGTEAAATTVEVMTASAETPPPPFHFRADRPFIFFIEDVNGIILFAAVVNSITD